MYNLRELEDIKQDTIAVLRGDYDPGKAEVAYWVELAAKLAEELIRYKKVKKS